MDSATEKRLDELMEQYFKNIGTRFRDLKPKQRQYISEILDGKDVMVLMPTAGGKSICFQLPALYWSDCVTIVISPLRALIREQIKALNEKGKMAAVIGSRSTIDLVYEGEGSDKERYNDIIRKEYRLIYITPEMLTNNMFLRIVRRIGNRIKMIAVDEAHCVSTWGYSFRPSYLNIRRFVGTLPKKPIISAYTATATRFIVRDTIRALGLNAGGVVEELVYDRPDLVLHVAKIYKRKDDDTPEGKSMRITKQNRVFEIVRKKAKKGYRGLIFCATPKEVNSIYGYLVSKSEKLGCGISRYYGSGMSAEERKENLKSFRSGDSLVMVATNAFGMGINMQGIRFVVHYNIPLCIEDYCQEVGRAAREKDITADCYLLYSPKDKKICNILISKNPYPDRRKLAYERFEKMVEYAEKGGQENLSDKLLHRKINDYFQDPGKEIAEEPENTARRFPLYVNRTYVANEIRKGNCKAGYDNVKGLHFGKKSYVCYKLYQGDFGSDARLSYFDMMIADAIYTLWLNNRPIYAKSIWILLTGDEGITLKKEKKEEIEKSIHRLQETTIKIEYQKGNYGIALENEEEEAVFEGPVFSFEARAKETSPYVLKCISPLYLYAEIQGQFHIFSWEQLRLCQTERKAGSKKIELVLDEKGNAKKMQSTIENTVLKHYLLRRMDLLSEPGIENKVEHDTEILRKRGVVHGKKRSGVLSNKINYVRADGVDLLEQIGAIHATDYKYTLIRQREEMIGTAVPIKNEDGSYSYEKKKTGRIEKILDYYVYMKMLSGYESLLDENEIRVGKEMAFSQIKLENYRKQEKRKYKIDLAKQKK